MRGAAVVICQTADIVAQFLLTRLMRGAAVCDDAEKTKTAVISTHAPHARRGHNTKNLYLL